MPRADEPFELHGVVMRAQLLRMLKHRIGFCKPCLDASLPAASALVPATQVSSAAWEDSIDACCSPSLPLPSYDKVH